MVRDFCRNRVRAVTPFLIAVTCSVTYAGDGLRFVDDDAPDGGDGTSWTSAYRFLADAIADVEAHGVNEIHVAGGVYAPDRSAATPDGTGNRNASFLMLDGVALLGGYAGLGAADPDARDLGFYTSFLTGDLAADDLPGFIQNGDNSYHVVYAGGVDATAVLDGFVVTAGNADGFQNGELGGGLLVDGGAPSITACTFTGNSAGGFASGGGGGVGVVSGAPVFGLCVFMDNRAAGLFGSGGGVFGTTDSDFTMLDCLVAGNTVGALGQGGGVAVTGSDASLGGCLFIENDAEDGGGLHAINSLVTMTGCAFYANSSRGVSLKFGTTQVTGCTFQSNAAPGAGGGGLACENGALAVRDSVFSGNTADSGGGLLFSGVGSMTASDCRFEQNQATSSGGGANLAGGSPQLRECIFIGNTAALFGGGLATGSGSVADLAGCTFHANTAVTGGGWWAGSTIPVAATGCRFIGNVAVDSEPDLAAHGGGLSAAAVAATNCAFHANLAEEGGAIDASSGSTIVNCTVVGNVASLLGGGMRMAGGGSSVVNCIAWGNVDGGTGTAQILAVAGAPAVSYSCVAGGWAGPGAGNIQLDPSFLDQAGGDLRLQAGSPCIDAGDNDAVPTTVEWDLGGAPRVSDDPDTDDTGAGSGPPMVDMGAHEFQFDAPCTSDVDGDGEVGVDDLVAVVMNWGCSGPSCDGDVDGSGAVDILDLVEVLLAWGLCP